ncbi:epoxide hydrolase, partial [Kribbella turkmenica]
VYDGMQAWKAYAAQQAEGGSEGWGAEGVTGPPTGVAVFGAETAIRKFADPAGKMTHWQEYDRGGHFAAMEVPDLLAADLRLFFGPLR